MPTSSEATAATTSAAEAAAATSTSERHVEGFFFGSKKLSSLFTKRYATAGTILTGRLGE